MAIERLSLYPDGNVQLITTKEDLIYDRLDRLVEHWRMERDADGFLLLHTHQSSAEVEE